MAKFTKLNIGDSVASSGGRVWKKLSTESAEVQDELQGTWVFNDSVEGIGLPGEQIIYNVNFASNNVTYNQIKLMEGNRLRIEDLAYNNTSVYNRTDGWVGEAYKTITITSKLSEFDDPTFIAWLKANATKIA